jgi:hypothetical protein
VPVTIEDEHLVVALQVTVLLRRKMNAGADVEAALICGVDRFARVDVEGQVLEPDLVVAMLTTVRGPQAELLIAVSQLEVHDFFGATVGGKALPFVQSNRSEHREIEGERALPVRHGQIDMVDPQSDPNHCASFHSTSSRGR